MKGYLRTNYLVLTENVLITKTHLFNTCLSTCKLYIQTDVIRKSKSNLLFFEYTINKHITNQKILMSCKALYIHDNICKRTKSHTLSDYIKLTPAWCPKSIIIARG